MKRPVFLLWLALSSAGWAWDFRCHQAVAAIAWDQVGHVTEGWLDQVLDHHPDGRARARDGAAIWPDLIRRERPETGPWHYINLPLGPRPDPPQPGDQDQVIWAIEHWRQVAEATGETPLRAEALSFLIHFVGDIHQPVHCACYFGGDTPDGDLGGIRVKLQNPGYKNLHHFWDSGAFPLEMSAAEIKAEAERAPCGALVLEHQPSRWAQESFEWARTVAYPDQRPPKEIGPEYAQQVRSICAQRIHLAGHRLAHVLRKLGPGGGYARANRKEP